MRGGRGSGAVSELWWRHGAPTGLGSPSLWAPPDSPATSLAWDEKGPLSPASPRRLEVGLGKREPVWADARSLSPGCGRRRGQRVEGAVGSVARRLAGPDPLPGLSACSSSSLPAVRDSS